MVQSFIRASVKKAGAFQGNGITRIKEKETNERKRVDDDIAVPTRKPSLGRRPPEKTGNETLLDLFRWPLLLKYTVVCSLLS